MVLMTQSSLSDVESKDKEFSAKQLMALCGVLQVSPEYLLKGGGEEDMGSIELQRIYRELDPARREFLLETAQGLAAKANAANRKKA